MVTLPLQNKVVQGRTPWTRTKKVLKEVGGRTQWSRSTMARRKEIPLQGTGMTERFREHSPT